MYKIYIFMQKQLIRILARALHEYVNFVHDTEKQSYRHLATGMTDRRTTEVPSARYWVLVDLATIQCYICS